MDMPFKVVIVNTLTLLRLGSVPLLLTWLGRANPLWGLAYTLFTLGALSDFFDGYLARKWQVTTTFGSVIDPLADKVLALSLLGLLTVKGVLPQLLFFAMLARDVGIVLGALFLKNKARMQTVTPLWVGKLHTTVQFFFIFLCLSNGILLSSWPNPGHAGIQVCLFALWGTTLASALRYGAWGVKTWIRSARETSSFG